MRSLVAALTLFSLTAHAEAPATVALVQGKVMIRQANGTVTAHDGMELAEADEVQVPPGGLAVLRLANGYPVRIDEDLTLAVHDIELRKAKPIDPLTRLDSVLTPSERQTLGDSLAGVQARLKGNSGNSVTAENMNAPGAGPSVAARPAFSPPPKTVAAAPAAQPAPPTTPSPKAEPMPAVAVADDEAPSPAARRAAQAEEKATDKKTKLNSGTVGGLANVGKGEGGGAGAGAGAGRVTPAKPQTKLPPSEHRYQDSKPLRADSPAGKVLASADFQKCLADGIPADQPREGLQFGVHLGGGKVTQVRYANGLPMADVCRVQLVGQAVHRTEAGRSGWVWLPLK